MQGFMILITFLDGAIKLNLMGQGQQNAYKISSTATEMGVQVDAEIALKPATFVLQYGYGIGSNLGQLKYTGEDQGDNAFRFIALSDLDRPDNRFSIQSAAWFEFDANENINDLVQTSIVTRPDVRVTDYFHLVAELGLGYNSVLNSSQYNTQYKLTFAQLFCLI